MNSGTGPARRASRSRLAVFTLDRAANGPPTAFWHIRQWQTVDSGVSNSAYRTAPHWQPPVMWVGFCTWVCFPPEKTSQRPAAGCGGKFLPIHIRHADLDRSYHRTPGWRRCRRAIDRRGNRGGAQMAPEPSDPVPPLARGDGGHRPDAWPICRPFPPTRRVRTMPDATDSVPAGATAALVLADGTVFWGRGFGAHTGGACDRWARSASTPA